MNLSDHFTLEEAVASETAARRGIDNDVPAILMPNVLWAARGMEVVRAALGQPPVRVTSWYRCPALNALVGSQPTSAHVRGLAVDFIAPAFGGPLEVATALSASTVDFDQVIHEFGRWCHVGFAPEGQVGRRMLLTIDAARGTRVGLLPV
jgi:zinc D-Ala-D-Ala carboxypeptidase